MSDTLSINFENADSNSLGSVPVDNVPSVKDEIARGQQIYKNRKALTKENNKSMIQPLYEKNPSKSKTRKINPFYFKLICPEPKPRKYKPCKHTGNSVIDRDILTRREHDAFLAQPRMKVANRTYQGCYYVKKYFSPCTDRIEQLSLPKNRKLAEFWNENTEKITPHQSENTARLLIESRVTSIGRAIELCNDERMKINQMKRKNLRKAFRIKQKIMNERKSMVRKIALNIFTAMQDFLLHDQDLEFNDHAKILSEVIAQKLSRYKDANTKSESVLTGCICGVADSLAIWIQKIAQVCHFGSQLDEKKTRPMHDPSISADMETPEQYPIDDYIEYEGSSKISECSSSTRSVFSEFETETDNQEGENGETMISEVEEEMEPE